MSIVGVGLDIIELEKFERFYSPDDSDLLERCFTMVELGDIEGSPNWTARLAGRFAAKEAVLKVLGGLRQGLAWTDIEVALVNERPELRLTGMAESLADELNVASWNLSLTHTEKFAAAVAIASR